MSDGYGRHYWLGAAEKFKGMTPDEAEAFVRKAPDFRARNEAERRYWENQIRFARRAAARGEDGAE